MKTWMKKLKNICFGFTGTAIHCSKCKSLNVTFGKSKFKDNTESYTVRCKDCNAYGLVTETWFDADEKNKSQETTSDL